MKKIIAGILLSCYLMPFVFLAMNEDATTWTPYFYFVMIFVLAALCYGCIKTKNWWIVVIGNILSFTSSCIFAWNFQTPKWEYYFKPFLPNQLIIFETVIAFLIQIAIVIHYSRKDSGGVENEKENI